MNILTLQFDQATISSKTRDIAQAFCRESANIREADFEVISGRDVACLFGLYDRHFFDGWLEQQVAQQSADAMRFRVSSRMTRAGAKTTRTALVRKGPGNRPRRVSYEIAVSSRLLFMSFSDGGQPVEVCGLRCHNRTEALQRLMEHEIIHLIELVQWEQSSCNQPRFKRLAGNIFGHRHVRHSLITPTEAAKAQHGISVGSPVTFEFEGRRLVGRVNRITRRATVLVESGAGQRYSNGKHYEKYYVPLSQLKITANSPDDAWKGP